MSISVKAQTKSFAGQSFSRKYAKELLQGVVASRPFGRRRHFRTLLLREFQLCSAKTAALSEQPTRKVFFEVMAGKSVVTFSEAMKRQSILLQQMLQFRSNVRSKATSAAMDKGAPSWFRLRIRARSIGGPSARRSEWR
jgi:hypothetical protein